MYEAESIVHEWLNNLIDYVNADWLAKAVQDTAVIRKRNG